jgi:transcriptional regulator with XRE-family HTH domain
MLTTTLDQGLRRYAIGEKLRTLRLKKKMGLVELGRHTGLSPAMLSKIERGRLYPTLPTLLRIAMVFSVGLEFFFAGARERPPCGVVRKADRMTFPEKSGAGNVQYHFESLDYAVPERKLNAYKADFLPVPPENLRRHAHAGGEFIYVLSGTLSVHVGDEEHAIGAGDAMYFDPSVPHAYRRSGGKSCSAIVVTTA